MDVDRTSWIKDLVRAEEDMEQEGIVDAEMHVDKDRILVTETLRFLQSLKNSFIEAATTFNDLKSSPVGRIKIYGIAKTHADFMLFRNGYKMIFGLKAPGKISIRFNFIGASYIPTARDPEPQIHGSGAQTLMEEHVIDSQVGAFGEVEWVFKGHKFALDNLVRHYTSLYVRESAK